MYHSEAFYQYRLGDFLHTNPCYWVWTLDQSHFTTTPKSPPPNTSSSNLHLPGDGTCCCGVCHSNRTLDSRARDHIKTSELFCNPWDPCTYRPQVFWLSCIAIEVQVNMWNKCFCLSVCVAVQRDGGFHKTGERYLHSSFKSFGELELL